MGQAMIDTGTIIRDQVQSRVINVIWGSIWDRGRSRGGDRICESVWERVSDMVWDRGWTRVGDKVKVRVKAEDWDNLLEAE